MVSPKYKNKQLFVQAVPHANVREIDENGKPLMALRVVGKVAIVDTENNSVEYQVLPEGVIIPYHWHYIAQLKEGSLVPMDLETAQLSGSNLLFNQGNN